jgi:acyl dehydratase
LADEFMPGSGALSPGVDEVRWLGPVRPGDVLHIRVTVREARITKSRPDRGIVSTFIETFNQAGVVVMTFKAANFILTRAAVGK